MTQCNICGIPSKIMINCSICKGITCIHCFYVKLGLCADCIILEYQNKYRNKIDNYAKEKLAC